MKCGFASSQYALQFFFYFDGEHCCQPLDGSDCVLSVRDWAALIGILAIANSESVVCLKFPICPVVSPCERIENLKRQREGHGL